MRSQTAENNRALQRRWLSGLGARPFQKIRASDLNDLYGQMLTDGRRHARATRGAGVSKNTTRILHALVSGAMSEAVKQGRLRSNPAKRASPPSPDTPETPTWTLAQLQAFLDHPAVRAHDDYRLLRVAAATGMRRSELLALAWSSVDLEAGRVTVKASLVESRGSLDYGPPKTRKGLRTIEVGPGSVAVLRAHQAAQDAHRAVMGTGWHAESLVFAGVAGRPRRPSSLSRAFVRLVEATGLPRVSFHSLRHAHETLLLDRGLPLHQVAARLGHDAKTMLAHYAHVAPGSQGLAAGLEALLDGDTAPLHVVERTDERSDADESDEERRRALP